MPARKASGERLAPFADKPPDNDLARYAQPGALRARFNENCPLAMPFLKSDRHPHAEDVVAHIEHAVNVCGEDHVGIGTDGSVTAIDDLSAYHGFLAKQVSDRARSGLGASGERADAYPFVIDLRGPEQFRNLAALLKARGHSAARIEKILGLNFLRFATDVWGD